tara:strand:+ start:259 stop:918 length:660 start_codon:yes stop_codon:yes gene_type:complete
MNKVLTMVLGVVFLTTTVSGSFGIFPQKKFIYNPKSGSVIYKPHLSYVGVRLGGNLANVSGEGESDARLGVSVIGLVDYSFTNSVSLITGLGYSQKGAKRSVVTMKNDYLTVPVQFNYTLSTNGSALLHAFAAGGVNFHVFGGGYLGYLLSAKQGSEDVKSQTESLDFGVTAGLAVTKTIENHMIRLDVAYELGLANQATSGEDFKNRVFILGLSYLFY